MNDQKNRTPSTISSLTGLVSVLLSLTACGGSGSGESDQTNTDLSEQREAPSGVGAATGEASVTANTDVAESIAGEPVTVSILSNDSFELDAMIQLIGTPANGTSTLSAEGTVTYVANADFEGTDSVTYALVDADGNQSIGKLYIAVACADCAIAPVASPGPSLSGAPYCVSDLSDSDGDGYGWEDSASCEVLPTGTALVPFLAKVDNITLDAGRITTIAPLRNDSIADRASVVFSIDVEPSKGRIEAVGSGIVVYAAPEGYIGSDSIVYSIKDAGGETSVASIDFNITCDTCTNTDALRLSWPSNPALEEVDGYRVYFGHDQNSQPSSVLSEVSVTSFNGEAPNVIYNMMSDLNISGSDGGGCFRVQAYRGAEVSEHSNMVCFIRS